jgi:hypothetical protein
VRRAQGLGDPFVRVLRVEDVVLEIGADLNRVEGEIWQARQRLGRELHLGDAVVLEVEVWCQLEQCGPVGTAA